MLNDIMSWFYQADFCPSVNFIKLFAKQNIVKQRIITKVVGNLDIQDHNKIRNEHCY